MKSRKKILTLISLILSLVMLFSLAACSIWEKEAEDDGADYAVREEASEAGGDYYPASASHTTDTGSGPSDTSAPAPADAIYVDPGEAFVLTAGEWNDNDNWPFFTNLVNSGAISFPSYGIDPRGRIKVTLTDDSGIPLEGESVVMSDDGGVLWTALTNKNGVAYLFYYDGETPRTVSAGGASAEISYESIPSDDAQSPSVMRASDEISLVGTSSAQKKTHLQVMFIVDTTGSMSDELTYLQKDFASIASDTGSDNITYSVNFYRDEEDEYVTKTNGFTSDVSEVSRLLMAEYADGGGDLPEAVAQILDETITHNNDWSDESRKLAFLIFDAPPHSQYDALIDEAVRSASQRGIMMIPVVASNADRDTELFGRALAICTNGDYVFLTDDSGVGESHLEPIIGDYTVELLHDIIVRIINENKV
ncbi:MAG: VWA domain-containing protein [Clostridia bacterium]|nr:VWA domain-containing protein [Clostridia bacterium]